MDPQSQNPEDLSRNPKLRMKLDRIEAESEIQQQQDPLKYTSKFSEGARLDLEKIFLKVSDPEKYQLLCEQIELRWSQSWQELTRYNPSELKLSISPTSRYQLMSLLHRVVLAAEGNGEFSIEKPPSLEVLIESPAVKDDFFKAFKITSVQTVLSWHSLLAEDEKQDTGGDLERIALQVGATNLPQALGRYLIIPDSTDLASSDTFLELSKYFIAQKTSPTFFDHCQLTQCSRQQLYQDRLAKMGVGEWLAHKALDFIAMPIFAFMIKREKASTLKENSKIECKNFISKFPILKELGRDWSFEMLDPISPADAPIREYLELDPEAV